MSLRVGLVVMGSRGDVQPFVALGAALRRRGHEVRLATHGDLAGLVREAGLEFRPLPGSARHLFESPEVIASLRRGPSRRRLARGLPAHTAEQAAEVGELLRSYVDAAVEGVDLVVASVANRESFLVREPDVPWCLVSWYPDTPTGHLPAMGAPDLPLGTPYRRLTHRFSRRAQWRTMRPVVEAGRARRGLAPLGPTPPFTRQDAGRPLFYLHSPAVVPRPPDWPADVHLAGYWFWDRDREPSDELRELVTGGTPPVVLTFGSLWPVCPPGSLDLIAAEVHRHGRRLVVVDGPADGLPEGVLRVHDADYTWLFPRAAAVIHHGGFGTGAAALRAGVPQVVVPIFIDHPFWARRMAKLGVAPAPLPAAKLNRRRLRPAVTAALTDGRMRARASRLGAEVRQDRGLEHACDVLQAWAAGLDGRRRADAVAQ